MATAATASAAIHQAATSNSVDESLWWDSFVALFEELDAAPLSSDLPDHLVKKVKSNHSWFVDSVAYFKPPSQASRLALDSPHISIGSRRLPIKPELKEAALRASACLCLDEVQSYILVKQSTEFSKPVADVEGQDFLHLVLLQYYCERQCLLKCIRRLFGHALCLSNESCSTNHVKTAALQLVHDGLERKLFSVITSLLSSAASEKSDVDFMILWVEESIIEDNLIFDVLFLVYYDNFVSCNSEQWKNLCSLFKDMLCGSFSIEKLAVSLEARRSFSHAKSQLLLILIETLDLENLLRMVHDEVPYRQGFSVFSLSDVQEMDALVSCFSALGATEAGPLILAWAVFVCLLLTLPDRTEYSILTEIDHIGYLRQSFEFVPFHHLHEILCNSTLRDSDGPVSGYLSVLRTLLSAFIASYELNQQTEDGMLNMILDILCEIYCGEESLCTQFWDRDSFVDGPIRSLLYVLEREYPFHTVQLVRLLSSLCSEMWSAECVFNYLEKMNGITLLSEIPGDSLANSYNIIETQNHLDIPTFEGIIIPCGTRGQILRVISANTALVRWEFAHSGLFLLLLRLAQKSDSFSSGEALFILQLFDRMMSANTGLCFRLLHIEKSIPTRVLENNSHIEMNVRIDMVKVISTLVFNLSRDVHNAHVVSICFNILVEMLKCAPSHVIEVVSRSNIFGMTNSGASSTWLLSGGLARLLLADNGKTEDCLLLTTSVLDFTSQLVENGGEGDLVSALVVFSIRYVLVNHVHWKYKMKYSRWKVTLKVLEVIKSCIKAIHVSHRLGPLLREVLFFDSTMHSFLCQILCISPGEMERSHVSRHHELKVTESLQLAVCSALDIVHALLAYLLKETFPSMPTFVQNMLSSTTKSISLVTATVTLLNFFHDCAIQVASAKLFSMLCVIASWAQPYAIEKVSLVVDSMQIKSLSTIICQILDQGINANEELVISTFDLLTSAARYQPALLVSLVLNEDVKVTSNIAGDMKDQLAVAPVVSVLSKTSCVGLILEYVRKADTHINSAPRLLLSVLNLLKALWDGGVQYIYILDKIRSSGMFWRHLASVTEANISYSIKDLTDPEVQGMTYRYKCQGMVLEIMARDLFLQGKLLQNDISEKKTSTDSSKEQYQNKLSIDISKSSDELPPSAILSTWCASSTLDSLITLYSSSGYDMEVIARAKRAVCLCIVHLIALLSTGNAGNLSISFVEKINIIYKKLREHPAFATLIAQYSIHRYSEGKELTSLLLNDLYYHLHGELEGRQIVPGPFQELSDFLLELETFQRNACKDEQDMWPPAHEVNMFDIRKMRADLGIELWDHSDWKASKEIAEKMLLHMQEANVIMSLAGSKHFALEALTAVISVQYGNGSAKESRVLDSRIFKKLIEPSITYVCNCLEKTKDSIVPSLHPPEILLKILAGQAELLLVLSTILFRQNKLKTDRKQFLGVSLLLIKTSCSGIRFLDDARPSTVMLTKAVKFLLMLLLSSIEFSYPKAYEEDESDLEADHFSMVSLACIGLLPVLCKYIEHVEYSNLSVASVDLMLKVFLAPNSWLPIIEKHLQLQHIVQRIQQKDAIVSIDVTLNFLLTLSNTKSGAKLLHSANLLSSMKGLFGHLVNDKHSSSFFDGSEITSSNDEAFTRLWGLGLAIITSMIYSLGDDPSCVDILDSAMCYFFSDNAYILPCFLSVPSSPTSEHFNKKRSRNQMTQTSLMVLRLTEDTLALICVLARHQALWSKGVKEMNSELRERSIHLLAFISRGVQRNGESPIKAASVFCPPTVKEEVDLNERPSFVNSKHGWFALCAHGLSSKNKVSATSDSGSLLLIKDQGNGNGDLIHQTHFSDMVAIQMYRVTFLLLKFLCMQAKAAVKRAEEVEYIDLAHFPELPMPEILHGIQDQAIAIVTDVCNTNRLEPIQPETGVCALLLQILEKSLYLELCVSQSCGMRPVLGRVEDFSKKIKVMVQVVEQHSKFKAALRSLRQILEQLYPGLLHSCNLI